MALTFSGGDRVVDAPELGGEAVVEGGDDQLQAGPASQWCVAAEQAAHEGHRRSAQQQAGPAGLTLGTQRCQRVLDDRRQLRVRPHQVGELIDDDRDPPLAAQREQRVHRRVPCLERERSRRVEMVRECGSQPIEGLPVGGLVGSEVEAACRLAQRPQQERLALAAAPGHHAQACTRGRIGGERRQGTPLLVTIEHFLWPDDSHQPPT